MYKVVFIFSSPPQKVEEEFEGTTDVSTIKCILLTDLWPSDQMAKSSISYLRFFSMGRELPNSLKIRDIKIPNSDCPIPVLVQIIKGDPNESKKDSMCDCFSCRIL